MKNKLYWVIEILLGGAIAVCVATYVAYISHNKNSIIPDYAPGTIDTNAIKEDNKVSNSSKGTNSARLIFSNVVSVDKKNKEAKLYYKNPGESTENVVLYLIIRQNDKEIILGKSDLIPVGYAIYTLPLDDLSNIPVGGYDGIIKLLYYNEKTNVKEMVDSEIKVSIEVK